MNSMLNFCKWLSSYLILYQFGRAAKTKYHKLGGLQQQKLILSQFWRLEVQNQGVNRVLLPPKPPGENPSLPLPAHCSPRCSLAYRYIIPVSASVFTWHSPRMSLYHPPFVCVSVSKFPLLIRTLVVLDEGRSLLQYGLTLTNYICHNPIPKYGHILRYWGLGFNISFWGDTIHP